jgi:hypothetical protein
VRFLTKSVVGLGFKWRPATARKPYKGSRLINLVHLRGLKMKSLVSLSLVAMVALLATAGAIDLSHAVVIEQEATVTVNIGINYGNGTIEWYNGTVPSGEFLLNATMRVATVEFTNYSGFTGPGLPGAFVTSINGVAQNPAANLYWTYWVYNPQTQQYVMGQVGAGSYALTSDQTVQWYYQNTGSLTNPALQPYTTVSLDVRLDSSTNPPTAVMSGAIYPVPGGPVNVTLEYSDTQGASYQQITEITSAADGTFSYSWQLPGGGLFMIRADAQGVKSPAVSIGTSSGVPGFPFESLLVGIALGLWLGILGRKRRPRTG